MVSFSDPKRRSVKESGEWNKRRSESSFFFFKFSTWQMTLVLTLVLEMKNAKSGGSFWELLAQPQHFEKRAHCWRELCPQSQIRSGFWFRLLCFGVSCVLDRWGDWTGPRLRQSWDHQISSSSGTLCPLWPVHTAEGVRCASEQCTLHNVSVLHFPKSSCPPRRLYCG